MPCLELVRQVPVVRTPRVLQVEGIFDVPPSERSEERWTVHLPIEGRDWQIGLVVGPSGCGKSTIANEVWGERVCRGFEWDADRAVVDGFPKSMGIKDVTALLSSVGFSSPPLWLRPYRVLSTGQQMRVNVARLLAENQDVAVMDEFTSVVDRTVAQIGSAAIAKTVRRTSRKFVAVTCHYDVADWLQPDWVYQPHTDEFSWRFPGARPPIELEVVRVHYSAWELFRPYHYLNRSFNKSARLFVAFWQGVPVAMQAVIKSPHPRDNSIYRGHRAVCLPDYQGVGIGSALIGYIASAYRGLGYRILSTTASPALIASRQRDRAHWKCLRAPGLAQARGTKAAKSLKGWTPAVNRLTSTWEYIGGPMDRATAKRLVYDAA